MLKEHYYWPSMSIDMEHFMKRCSTCDGVPTTNGVEEGPTSHTRFNSNSKVRALAQVVEESLKQATGLKNQFILGFVHLIT